MTALDTGPGDAFRTSSPNQHDDRQDTAKSPNEIAHQADAHLRAYLIGATHHPANDVIDESAVWVIADSCHVDALMRLIHGCSLPGDVTAIEELRRETTDSALKTLKARIDEGRLS